MPSLGQRHAKLISDRYTSTIIQSAFLAYVNRTSFPRDLQRYRTIYGERRDAMLDALQREMPDGVTWTHPAAGFHLWLTMKPIITIASLPLYSLETSAIRRQAG